MASPQIVRPASLIFDTGTQCETPDAHDNKGGRWLFRETQLVKGASIVTGQGNRTADVQCVPDKVSSSSSGSYYSAPSSPVRSKPVSEKLIEKNPDDAFFQLLACIREKPECQDGEKLKSALELGEGIGRKKKAKSQQLAKGGEAILWASKGIIPRDLEVLEQWIVDQSHETFSVLCFALACSQSKDREQVIWGVYCLNFLLKHHPDEAAAQIHCWLALYHLEHALLTDANKVELIEYLEAAAKARIPVAQWILGMGSLGLIKQLPAMEPRLGFRHLLEATKLMNPIAIRETEVVSPSLLYMMDPLTFGSMEALAKDHEDGIPQNRILQVESMLSLHDPSFKSEFLPWFFKRLFAVNGSLSAIEDALSDIEHYPIMRDLRPVIRMLESLRDFELHYHCNAQKESSQILALLLQKKFYEEGSPQHKKLEKMIEESRIEAFEKMHHFRVQLSNREATKAEKAVRMIRKALEQAYPDFYKGLLNCFLGIALELEFVKESNHRLKAAEAYRQAANLAGFTNLLHFTCAVYIKEGQYEKAAQVTHQLADAVLVEESRSDYRKLAESYMEKYEESKGWPTLDEAEELTRQVGLELSPETQKKKPQGKFQDYDPGWIPVETVRQRKECEKPSRQKKKHKNNGAEHLSEVDSSDGKKGAERHIRGEERSDPVQPSPLPPAAKKMDSPVLAAMNGKRELADLLPRKWPDELKKVPYAGYKFRAEGFPEKERSLLLSAMKKYYGQPGVERIHEEYAWHLMRLQDEPVMLFAMNNESLLNRGHRLKPLSRDTLKKAELHLRKALAIKLQLSLSELPEDPLNDAEVIAEGIVAGFENEHDKRDYWKSFTRIMSSFGHLYERMGGLSYQVGHKGMTQKSAQAYGHKRH
ncbi:hypothetical protein [Endozoicomonas numazuensis]|uniref:Uncharacterized protein n=1 Tax=Endozoicomonas numazuensis TaxID=1137799 RepID=A0A081NHU4_9GAMM|nr:hypothetical protein [Endozoicomonas numazuensis]KEQ18017.1 hypothetical protein GZ78_10490 [Endozoicomonas numazuensis]